EVRTFGDPLEEGADVLVRVLAQEPVVEREERLAVARRAAHVWTQNRDAHFVNEVVLAGEETGAELALRAAVNVDNHRPLAAEPRRRPGKIAGDRAFVEARPAHQLGLGKFIRAESTGLAVRPAV